MPIVIPKRGSICPAKLNEPYNITIYGYPKIGKTSALAALPDITIIDCQISPGTSYITTNGRPPIHVITEAEREGINPHEALIEILEQWIKDPTTFLAIDPLTEIVEWAETKATAWFKTVPLGQGKNAGINSVLELVGRDENSGSPGWMHLRRHFMDLMKQIWARKTTRTIFIGHVREAMLVKLGEKGAKVGTDVDGKDLDLPGKLKNIFLSENDAAAYMSRNIADGGLELSFKPTKTAEGFLGCRVSRLINRVIKFHTPVTVDDWRQVYPDTLERLAPTKPAATAPQPTGTQPAGTGTTPAPTATISPSAPAPGVVSATKTNAS